MNNLGGMVFIVFGIALGYWVLTGKAANFIHAINAGTPAQQAAQQGGNQNWWQVNPPPGSLFQFLNTQAPGTSDVLPISDFYNGSNVSQNVPASLIA